MFRSRILGLLAPLNFWAFSAIGLSHDRRVEIGNPTNPLCHLFVHVVCSNGWAAGLGGVFPSPLVS
jgi:hypothetical protein